MRLATTEQSRQIEEITQSDYGIDFELLMESAGSLAAREIDQAYFPELKKGEISILCGPGNNGGDGLVVARHLHSMGYRDLTVYTVAPKDKKSILFKKQFERAELSGIRVIDLIANPEKTDQILGSKIVIDGLFGIGLTRKIEDPYDSIVSLINRLKVPVVSLDIPSGLDADRGYVLGNAVRASMTITFGLGKPGFFVGEGPLHVGRLRILPIGFPFEVLRRVAVTHFGFHERLARRYLPTRSETSNKSDHGHLLVLAGSEGKWGAGILCATGAYRMGAGYVTFASFDNPKDVLKEIPEVYTTQIDDENIFDNKKINAVVIGPGLGTGPKTKKILNYLIKNHKRFPNVVVDADAISVCSQEKLFPLPSSWVMTPHTGELSRLINVEARTIESDRYRYALEASRLVGCHVLLKGFRSVLAHRQRCMVIMSGNAALAKAGTGDVLAGMIGGFLSQKVEPIQATATAAYIHGRLADEWVRSGNDRRSLLASDLGVHLPQLMGRIARGSL
jgi:ADP-dependent NAD(P)H-hydrate dehydratase / NAD(P)H-hydrate epimerase